MRNLLLMAALLVTLTFGSFAQAEPTPVPDLFTAESGATAPCAAENLSFELDLLEPQNKSVSGDVCGSCSLSPCKGVTEGSVCFSGGSFGHCYWATGLPCPTAPVPRCRCWTGPLP